MTVGEAQLTRNRHCEGQDENRNESRDKRSTSLPNTNLPLCTLRFARYTPENVVGSGIILMEVADSVYLGCAEDNGFYNGGQGIPAMVLFLQS
ncbi:hypothetical protein CEXT_290221 [Caerostris extrusa]|uniref:Uncharacterized protein n=1 Tax=Caerostris extrusa TaxID=172846 RepID=A0AAV4QV45_CAEEX|nr:hypothetical protein CEXT_290221 [Caerostris extrusa]